MSDSLENWLSNGWLVEQAASAADIAGLLGVVERDITDARVAGLSLDWKLTIAYNAALQAAMAALLACGYRPARESHHYRALQSLTLTVGAEAQMVVRLDRIRKKRNISDYEVAGAVGEAESAEALVLAEQARDLVTAWLADEHPELMP